VSDEEVASPLVPHPSTVIVMNKPSLSKFEDRLDPGGNLFINESLIDVKSKRDDITVYYIPANNLAEEAGSGRSSNMAMVGAFIAATGIVSLDSIKRSLPEVVSKRNLRFNDINLKALDIGFAQVKKTR
jgi:2-oxoglutarate ferredoxin oxidoreductase subunit gamma